MIERHLKPHDGSLIPPDHVLMDIFQTIILALYQYAQSGFMGLCHCSYQKCFLFVLFFG